jgi:hypothetical protein
VGKWLYINIVWALLLMPVLSYGQTDLPLVEFSHEAGLYKDQFTLKISGSADKYYYSLNGKAPKYRYKEPFSIKKSTVVKIQPIKNNRRLDTIITKSYIVGFETKMAVISLSIEPDSLWGEERGMLVRGPDAYIDSTDHLVNANYQKKIEMPVHVEFFDEAGERQLNQPSGIRVFGETTRKLPDKSLRIVARKKYGDNRFRYQMFPEKDIDTFKHLVIRQSGNDYKGSRFKDALSTQISRGIGVDYQAFRPAQMFINGQYWGVYNIREKINDNFLEENHAAHPDSTQLMMGKWVRQHGDWKPYFKMFHFFEKLDTMDDRNYRKAAEMLDIRNYINFRIAQIYLNNHDSRGNIRYWRSTSIDNKFRCILYDTDHGFGIAASRYLERCLSPVETHWYNPKWSTLYLRKLMQNKQFQQEFAIQAAHLLNTNYHPDTVLQKIEFFHDLYKDELPRDRKLVARHLRRVIVSEEDWEEKVDKLRKFATHRPDFLRREVKRLVAKQSSFVLQIDGNTQGGKVSIHNNRPNRIPFSGKYFKRIPMKVEAIPNENYRFAGWKGGIAEAEIVVNSRKDTLHLEPLFVPITPSEYEGEIVFSQIHYQDCDWVELFNHSDAKVDISGWVFTANENAFRIPENTLITPRSGLVLCKDIEWFEAVYGEDIKAIGSFGFGLDHHGEYITLNDTKGHPVDATAYDPRQFNIDPDSMGMHVMALSTVNSDNADMANWAISMGSGDLGPNEVAENDTAAAPEKSEMGMMWKFYIIGGLAFVLLAGFFLVKLILKRRKFTPPPST